MGSFSNLNEMLGVVVWANLEQETMVVWCEDHGQIAYARGLDCLLQGAGHSPSQAWPAAGDLVAIRTHMAGGLRRITSLRMIEKEWRPDLPGLLAAEAERQPQPGSVMLRAVAASPFGEAVRAEPPVLTTPPRRRSLS